jgi:hypothetical protein
MYGGPESILSWKWKPAKSTLATVVFQAKYGKVVKEVMGSCRSQKVTVADWENCVPSLLFRRNTCGK